MQSAIAVDLDVDTLPEMRDASSFLGNPGALAEAWRRDGYWLFRGVLDRKALARLRTVYLKALKRAGVVHEDAGIPLYNGANRNALPRATHSGHGIYDDLARSKAWKKFVTTNAIDRFFTELLGERQAWVPVTEYRLMPPGDERKTPRFMVPHQDGYTTEGYESRTCWIPVWDVSRETGGLAVAEGMHRQGYLHDSSQPPSFPIPAGAIPDSAWRTSSFEAGDIVIFDRFLPHSGLRNCSDKYFRLSLDVRCTPAEGCPVLVGTLERATDRTIHVLARTLADEQSAPRPMTLSLDDSSLCRNVGEKGGCIPIEDVERIYAPGCAVMVVAEEGVVRLLRQPKY